MFAIRPASNPRTVRSLFAIFGIATIIPLVLLVVLPLQMAMSAIEKQSTARVADASALAADSLGIQLDAVKSLASSYSNRPEIVTAASTHEVGGANGTLRRTLREYQQSNPSIKSVGLLSDKGVALSSEPYNADLVGKDFSYRDYYSGAMTSSAPYVSEIFASAAAGNPNRLVVSTQIKDSTGKTVGILTASIDSASVLQKYVEKFHADHSIDLAIYDQKSHLVAAAGIVANGPAGNGQGTPRVLDDVHAANASTGTSWLGTLKVQNKDVISAYTPVAGSGWAIQGAVPKVHALAPSKAFETRVITIATILGAIVLSAIVLLARSVRAREKAENNLRRSEMRTRAILDTARQMFCELDEEGRITDWNAQAEEMLGWTRDDVVGKKAIDILVPEDRKERVAKAFKELLTASESQPTSHKETNLLIRKNSEQHLPVEVSSWVTTVEGRRSVNLFVQDITDRLRLQREQEVVVKRQRALVEELRAADKAKSDFISTISHELRTPLTSITGYLEMLQDGLGGPLNENQQMMIDVVDRNSRRLLALIEDVLTLSRIESGSFKLERTDVDIREIVTGAVETLLPAIHNNGITLDVDIAQSVGSVSGDHNQLERVVMNLVSNAVKFTPSGGRISVVAYRHDSTVTLTISDTGVGIPIEEQPHLFSRFFRASTAQDHAVQGTGLGLTIVKSIVERHGGSVALQSAVGVGTTVYVELPVHEVAGAEINVTRAS